VILCIYKGGIKLNKRLAELRKSLGMNQKDFASSLSLGQSTLAMIETGKRELNERNIKLICSLYKVNYDWLVNGIGDMFQSDDSDAQAIVDSVMTGDNEFAKKILVKFAKLSDEHWKQLQEILTELENN
jgi:HTH-type transcriptional regulator / antitoxin PezA